MNVLIQYYLDHHVERAITDGLRRRGIEIHSALAYYHENRQEIDQDIERRQRLDAELKARVENSPIQQKLRQIKNGQSL